MASPLVHRHTELVTYPFQSFKEFNQPQQLLPLPITVLKEVSGVWQNHTELWQNRLDFSQESLLHHGLPNFTVAPAVSFTEPLTVQLRCAYPSRAMNSKWLKSLLHYLRWRNAWKTCIIFNITNKYSWAPHWFVRQNQVYKMDNIHLNIFTEGWRK